MNTKIITIFILYILCLLVYYFCLKKNYFEYFYNLETSTTSFPIDTSTTPVPIDEINFDENINVKAKKINAENLNINTLKGQTIYLGNHIIILGVILFAIFIASNA